METAPFAFVIAAEQSQSIFAPQRGNHVIGARAHCVGKVELAAMKAANDDVNGGPARPRRDGDASALNPGRGAKEDLIALNDSFHPTADDFDERADNESLRI